MKKIYFVLFAILCTIVFSCTDNLISTDLDSHKNSVTSELRVFVKESRLIGPELSDVSWDVQLQKDNENDTISGKSINGYYLFSGLESGTYNISVFGKIDNIEKFTGSAKVILEDGKNLEIHVPVVASKPNNDTTTSTGFATITMEMSEELLSKMGEKVFFQAELVGADDKFYIASFVDEENQILLDNQEVEFVDNISTTVSYNIPTGYYYLTFSEFYPYSIKLKDNFVEIGDGLTTNIVLTQNDYEIVKNYSSVWYVNKNGAGDDATGSSLSDPIAFSELGRDAVCEGNLIYLLSDVEFSTGVETRISPVFEDFSGTISSFNSTVRTISANISDYSSSISLGDGITLRNIKLSGTNEFSFESLNIDETVILDCNLDAYKPVVCLSKSSNLVVGKNFSGDLYVSLFGDWKLGDTVINFENGKPENSNFYIDSECENSSGQKYSAMFYIDDSGKLAKYTDDFTSFAWSGTVPCLVTKTQAKNNTYTSIFYNGSNELDFTGVSTYDGNNTWYFIANSSDASGNTVSSLYKVSASTEYTDTVTPEKIEVSIPDLPAGVNLSSITAMDYDNGKLYMGFYETEQFLFYVIDTASNNSSSASVSLNHIPVDKLTALLVDGGNVYMATKNPTADNSGITHSAIWQLTLELTENGYILSPAQTYTDANEETNPVPYYQTSSDIFDGTTEGSTFRITDLYSDGTSVYGLLANYIETNGNNANGNVYMRGSVFKLQENSTSANATHYGLRKDSLQISDIPTAKQYFILPRKIVGIMNKKLIIADDGMIPDKTDCNLDRFILFDLDGTLSEKIDVNVPFKTSGTSSVFATGSLF